MSKTLTEMAAEIVAAQASQSNMTSEEIRETLNSIFSALAQIKNVEDTQQGFESSEAAISQAPDKLGAIRANPKRSIRRKSVLCLECGATFKQLTSGHLKEHDLTAKEYRKKWGFSARQPLSSQELSEKRRKSAEDRGLGEKLRLSRQQKSAQKSPGKKKAKA
ncbi:MAG: MucR family transcriptional regulator [Desulfatibacillaceae bacterium]|nr:MucR family transcriptional regulator [Desulfatibacillaceae bacterium]